MDMNLDKSSLGSMLPASQLALVDSVLLAVAGRLWELERDTTPYHDRTGRPVRSIEELRTSRLAQDLLLIAEYVSRGWITESKVEYAMERVYRVLFGDCLGNGYTLPEYFHKTELGQLFQEAAIRLSGPENLMTPAEVYRELGIARQTLYDRAKKGKLQVIYLHGESRFLRSEVEAWKSQRERKKKTPDSFA